MSRPLPELHGVEHAQVTVGDVGLHLAQSGEGRPLVLLHGFPQHWWVWHRLIAPLAAERRVIAPDLRGFGWSDAPADGYDKDTLAADVLGLLDELGVAEFDLAGHDWGGWLSYLIALRAPDRVGRMMAMGIHHPFWRATPSWAAGLWHSWHGMLVSAPGLGARALRPGARLGGPLWRWLGADAWSPEDRESFLAQFAEPERVRAARALYDAVGRRDMPRMLSGRYRRMGPLRVPALLLLGTRDRAIQPVRRRDYARWAPTLVVERVPAGHSIVDEEPQLVLDRMRRFLLEPARDALTTGRRGSP